MQAFCEIAKLKIPDDDLRKFKFRLKLEMPAIEKQIDISSVTTTKLNFNLWDNDIINIWINQWPGDNELLRQIICNDDIPFAGNQLLTMEWADIEYMAQVLDIPLTPFQKILFENRWLARMEHVKKQLGVERDSNTKWLLDIVNVDQLKEEIEASQRDADSRKKIFDDWKQIVTNKTKVRLFLWDLLDPTSASESMDALKDIHSFFLLQCVSPKMNESDRLYWKEMLFCFHDERICKHSTEAFMKLLIEEYENIEGAYSQKKRQLLELFCWWVVEYGETHFYCQSDRERARKWLENVRQIGKNKSKDNALNMLQSLNKIYQEPSIRVNADFSGTVEFSDKELALAIHLVFCEHWTKLKMVELKMSKSFQMLCTGLVDSTTPRDLSGSEEFCIRVHRPSDEFMGEFSSRRRSSSPPASFKSNASEYEPLHVESVRVWITSGVKGCDAVVSAIEYEGAGVAWLKGLQVGSQVIEVNDRSVTCLEFPRIVAAILKNDRKSKIKFSKVYQPRRQRLISCAENIRVWIANDLIEASSEQGRLECLRRWSQVQKILLKKYNNWEASKAVCASLMMDPTFNKLRLWKAFHDRFPRHAFDLIQKAKMFHPLVINLKTSKTLTLEQTMFTDAGGMPLVQNMFKRLFDLFEKPKTIDDLDTPNMPERYTPIGAELMKIRDMQTKCAKANEQYMNVIQDQEKKLYYVKNMLQRPRLQWKDVSQKLVATVNFSSDEITPSIFWVGIANLLITFDVISNYFFCVYFFMNQQRFAFIATLFFILVSNLNCVRLAYKTDYNSLTRDNSMFMLSQVEVHNVFCCGKFTFIFTVLVNGLFGLGHLLALIRAQRYKYTISKVDAAMLHVGNPSVKLEWIKLILTTTHMQCLYLGILKFWFGFVDSSTDESIRLSLKISSAAALTLVLVTSYQIVHTTQSWLFRFIKWSRAFTIITYLMIITDCYLRSYGIMLILFADLREHYFLMGLLVFIVTWEFLYVFVMQKVRSSSFTRSLYKVFRLLVSMVPHFDFTFLSRSGWVLEHLVRVTVMVPFHYAIKAIQDEDFDELDTDQIIRIIAWIINVICVLIYLHQGQQLSSIEDKIKRRCWCCDYGDGSWWRRMAARQAGSRRSRKTVAYRLSSLNRIREELQLSRIIDDGFSELGSSEMSNVSSPPHDLEDPPTSPLTPQALMTKFHLSWDPDLGSPLASHGDLQEDDSDEKQQNFPVQYLADMDPTGSVDSMDSYEE